MQRTVLNAARVVLGVCAAWLAYTQTLDTSTGGLKVQQIKKDLYVIEGTSNGSNDAGNIAIYVTQEGVVLVDDRFAQDYKRVVEAVKSVTVGRSATSSTLIITAITPAAMRNSFPRAT